MAENKTPPKMPALSAAPNTKTMTPMVAWLALILAVIAVVAASAALLAPRLAPALYAPSLATKEEMAVITTQLRQELSQPTGEASVVTADSTAIDTLRQELEALRAQVAQAKAAQADNIPNEPPTSLPSPTPANDGSLGAMLQELQNLTSKVTGLEQKPSATNFADKRAVGFALASMALLHKIENAEAYRDELTQLAALAPVDGRATEAMAALQVDAGIGIISHSELLLQFQALLPKLLASQNAAEPPANWWQRAANDLAALVVIRKIDGTPSTDVAALLNEAEAQMRHGRLNQALQSIDALPEAQAQMLATWRGDAAQRVRAIENARILWQLALSRLSDKE